jgi:hypothetical protein
VLRSFKKFPTIPYQNPSLTAPPPTPPNPETVEMKPKSQNNIRVNESNAQIPIGNGGIADHYYWTQTLKELTVYVDLDFQAKGKDIQCTITPSHLTLSARGQLILDDDFEEKVCVDESMWTISSDSNNSLSQVILTLDKSRKTWWKHVLVNDPEIDTTKVSESSFSQSIDWIIVRLIIIPRPQVDSTQKVSEYDDETQAAIRKIMFDQKQKVYISLNLNSVDSIFHVREWEYALTMIQMRSLKKQCMPLALHF